MMFFDLFTFVSETGCSNMFLRLTRRWRNARTFLLENLLHRLILPRNPKLNLRRRNPIMILLVTKFRNECDAMRMQRAQLVQMLTLTRTSFWMMIVKHLLEIYV